MAAEDLFGLSGPDVDRLSRLMQDYEADRLNATDAPRRAGQRPPVGMMLLKTRTTIGARTSTSVDLTTLDGAIDDEAQDFGVASIDGFDLNGEYVPIMVGAEEMLVIGVHNGDPAIRVIRGWNGSAAMAHADGTQITRNDVRLGSGTGRVCRIVTDTDGNETLLDSDRDETIYNHGNGSIAANQFVMALREPTSGKYVVTGSDSGMTLHIWANCRIDGDDVTVLFNDRIPFCTRVGAGKFVFGFDVDFVDENAFTWAGSLGNNEDYFYEVDRSPTSVTVQTASATDPEDVFGIAVHGKIAEAESDSSGSDIFEPGECTLATSPARYYHTRDFAALDGDCTVCAWLANNAFNPVTGACIELANYADCFWGANLGQYLALGHCTLDVEWARAFYSIVFFRDVTDGVYKLQWIITKQYTAEQHILAQYEVNDDTWPGDIPLTLTRTTSSTDDLGACNNWPATITLSPGTCTQTEECTTTVSFADADLDIAASTITITGTGFSTTPGDNIVTFNLGATGTVTASTSTTLTVTFTSPPTTGALTAIVTVGACSSGAAVQVATVVDTPSGCGDSGTLTDGGTTTISETPDGDSVWSKIATTEGVGVRVEYLVVDGDGGTVGVYTGTCPSGLTLRGTLTDSGCFYVDPADTEDGFVYIAWTSADIDSVVQIRATNGVDCSGDSCENALTMMLGITYSTPGVWYRFTPSTPGSHHITFTGSGTHNTWTGECDSLNTQFSGTTAGCQGVSISSGDDLFIQVSADTPMTIKVEEGACP